MKRPKYILESSNQRTLSELWSLKRNSTTEAKDDSMSNGNSCKDDSTKFKTPTKTPSKSLTQSRNTRSESNVRDSQCDDKENSSDDNEIVESSQDTSKSKSKSKLRKKISKNLVKRSKALRLSPQKGSNILSSDSIDSKLSISDLCNVSSNVIKDELVEMYDNIHDYESIEVTHDFSCLMADPKMMSNILTLSPPIVGQNINMESATDEDKLEADQLQDPMYVDETINQEYKKPTQKKRKRQTSTRTNPKRVCTSKRYSTNKRDQEDISERQFQSKNEQVENELSDELLKKLKFMKIELQHVVPPQHEIESCAGSHPLKKQERAKFKTYGPLKPGSFEPEEDAKIRKNWQDFCDIHGWDSEIVMPFLYMRHNGKYYIPELEDRKNFVRFLSNGIPWRSLYSIYFRFRNLYSTSTNIGKYTRKEDKIILSHMRTASASAIDNNCAKLARILNRKRHSVWQHYQKLKKRRNVSSAGSDSSEDSNKVESTKSKAKLKKNKKKKKNSVSEIKSAKTITHEKVYTEIKWTSPLVKKFIDTLMEATSCKELKDLKNKTINNSVWTRIQNNISIHRSVLKNFWYLQLHIQLFSPIPIYLNDIKIKFIEYLHENNIKCKEDISWENVCSSFDGVTTVFLTRLFEHLMQYVQTKINSSDLNSIVKYLYKYHIAELEEKTVDAILPKLYYKSGRIICLDKGKEKKISNETSTDPLKDEAELFDKMKRPKYILESSNQRTLSELWSLKRNSTTEAKDDSMSNGNSCKDDSTKFKTPTKTPSKSLTQSRNTRSESNVRDSQCDDKENSSDDNEIVESSQDTSKSKSKSKLRKKISKNLVKRSKALRLSPQKGSNILSSDSIDSKLSISDLCNVSSNVIKDELVEMYDNIHDYESIEMTHDFSCLMADPKMMSNILTLSPPIVGQNINMESATDEDKLEADQLQDPMYVDETINQEYKKPTQKKRKRQTSTRTNPKRVCTPKRYSTNKRDQEDISERQFQSKNEQVENELSDELLKKLKFMKIELQHVVPPQHEIESCAGSHPLIKQERAKFKTYGPLKPGSFEPEEDAKIRKNWQDFCDIHGWDSEIVMPFLYMRHNGKYYIPELEDRKNFVRFLSNGIPWRSLYSIYFRFRNLYSTSTNIGKYTRKEDKAKTKKKKKKNSVSEIKSAKTITHEKVYTEIKWTSPLVKKFIDTLMEATSCKELKDLKNKTINNSVWTRIQNNISIHRSVLKNFWYLQLHIQLFSPIPIYLNDIKIKFIEYLHENNIKCKEDISWENVCSSFDGVTTVFLTRLFEHLMQYVQTKINSSDLNSIVKYLYKYHIAELEEKTVDAILPKLYYKSGRIICLDKGKEKKISNKTSTDPLKDEAELFEKL